MLIPTAGDYVGEEGAPFVMLVFGVEGEYMSGPLVNDDGLVVLQKLRSLLTTTQS